MTACVELFDRDCIRGKRIHTDGVTKKGDPNNYQDRLKTFKRDPQSWSLSAPSSEDLARAGFIYTGQGTQVNCPSCGIYVEDWDNARVDPVRKHYIYNKRCGFLLANHAQRVHDFFIDSQYSDASLRLNSFLHWPRGAPVRPSDLASAGFYYVGEGTKARCFSCTVTYTEWKPRDMPLEIHRQLNPSCEFLVELLSRRLSRPIASIAIDAAIRLPDYSSPEVRLSSFKNWRRHLMESKEELAEAGLYLVEPPDVLCCYSCHVELKDWVPGDTATDKHRMMSPHCSLVRRTQGRVSNLLSVPTSDPQKQKPLANEGNVYSYPSELVRRHSDRSVYLPPSYATLSAPPFYARSSSFPNEPTAHVTPQWDGSVLCSGDVKADSPSPRWMLDAGVDIRLPPSLDVKRRPAQSYSVEPPTSAPRNTVFHLTFERFCFILFVCLMCLLSPPAHCR